MSDHKSLAENLAKVRDSNPLWKSRYDTLVQGLRDAGVGGGALKTGDTAPDFALSSAEGNLMTMADLLAKGPVVLSFYRGKWCPYCVTELEALREAATDIAAMGATLVAVTAEDCGGALAAKRKHRLEFEILCDLENGLGLSFGLIYRVPEAVQRFYREADINFPLIYGNDSWFLPIPATYVIGRDGVVRHAYVNPDFRERLDPAAILDVLKGLR
jgi:peroxiredoxin